MQLSGFMIRCHSPSDELNTVVDCSELPASSYLDFIRELQDVLSAMDELYSRSTQHRRTVKARYIKFVDSRRRVISFSPYPSVLLNRIKYIRAKLYHVIGSKCIVIQRFKSGMFERNIYLLPYEYAESFIKTIEKLNSEIDEVNEMLSEVNLTPIEEVIKKYNLTMLNYARSVRHIEVELIPFELTDDVVREWATKSPAVAKAIQEYKKNLIIDAINSIKPKLEEIITRLLAERKLKDVKKDLEELKKFVESVGLKGLSETVIEPLMEQAEGKIPLNPKISEWLEGRIASLIETL